MRCSAVLVYPIEELGYLFARNTDVLQQLGRAGPAEILAPGLEDQLVRLRLVQRLMLA
ncbi:MAG TPA: hypothetical protein VFO71_00405 [Gemmatimonadales bacterium]|nr:hypothetical protein [Gemmatimonadales bacterium]